MSDSIRTRCPHCQAALPLKSRKAVGKKVPCPRCRKPFVVKALQPSEADTQAAEDEFGPLTEDFPEESGGAAPPPVVVNRNRVSRKERRRRAAAAERAEQQQKKFAVVGCFSMLLWINAHLAVAVCVIDSVIYLGWMLMNFGELYERAVLGRFVVRQIAQPVIVIITALTVWWQGVLWRDISMRGAVVVFGAGYLFLFGLVAGIIVALTTSAYGERFYGIQWSAIYLGVSLLLFAFWGYGPETTLQRAERYTSEGRYSEALTTVQKALQEDPDDHDALDLERTLRDMIRYG